MSIEAPIKLLPLLELDPGELSAISLAVELKAPLLIDERMGRKIAKDQGLEIIGAVGVLERAANIGLNTDLRAVHDLILALDFHVDETVLQASLARHLVVRKQSQ